MSFRYREDGTIDFLHRGMPPATPKGYLPDPQDPWHFIPDLEPCNSREIREEETSCCGKRDFLACATLNMPISLQSCMNCSEEWLAEMQTPALELFPAKVVVTDIAEEKDDDDS